MGLKPTFQQSDISKQFTQMLQRIDRAVMSRFQLIGEQFIKDARNKVPADDAYRAKMQSTTKTNKKKVSIRPGTPGFEDETANLRASIGYVILRDGQRILSSFPGGGTGQTEGEKLVKELTGNYRTGYVLIVVAGMEYAAAVESLGYDVLTGSSFAAETDLRIAIQKLKKKL